MEERIEQNNNEAPHVDFSLQLSLDNNSERIESSILEWLKLIAKDVVDEKVDPIGAIVVLGDFEGHGSRVDGMVQMKPKQNPVESLVMIDTDIGDEVIKRYSCSPYDGAIVVHRSGQVLGAGIYLVIDNPMLETPDDCGTRHKAAASFSERNDVISVLTLSEETNAVRLWKDGKTKSVYKIETEK